MSIWFAIVMFNGEPNRDTQLLLIIIRQAYFPFK